MHAALATLAGLALIAIALRDIFQTLFRPAGRGHLARLLMESVWRASRRFAGRRPDLLSATGPALVVVVIFAWVGALVLGWALLYWPHLPESFLLSPQLERADQNDLLDGVYLSLVTLTTLGFGDVTPTAPWLRLVTPLEALVGFAVLSASITWIILIHGAVRRRRALAAEVAALRGTLAQPPVSLPDLDDPALERLLGELTPRLFAVGNDLHDVSGAYYFETTAERSSLAEALPYLLVLSKALSRPERSASVRLRASLLHAALVDLADALAGFLGIEASDPASVFRAYRAQRGRGE